MKKTLKRVLIASTVMVTALTAGLLTACAAGSDPEANKKKEGYSCTVTYDANGGTFGSNSARTYALVKENSLTPAPGYVDGKTQASVKVPTRRDHQLVGEAKSDGDEETNDEAILTKSWFLAKTDEEGNVVYEGEGEERAPVLLSEDPWNFTTDRVTGDITLVAVWKEVFRFSICYVEKAEDGTMVEKEYRSFTVEPGDKIVPKLYKKKDGELVRRADYISATISNNTCLDFYLDAEFKTYLENDYVHPGHRNIEVTEKNEQGEDVTTTVATNTVTVYAKYLPGRYQFISNDNIRSLTGADKWYFVEDVDMTGKEFESVSKFTGDIWGNGFTMKNLTVTSKVTKPGAGQSYKAHSIFGEMDGTVKDLTFENVTMKVATAYGTEIPGEQRINFIAYKFGKNGLLSNVTLQDCKIVADVLDDSANRLFTYLTGEGSAANGLWWEAPAKAQLVNFTMKANDAVVENIQVVEE